eukprot:756995-Hanusia_phi.AAC.2
MQGRQKRSQGISQTVLTIARYSASYHTYATFSTWKVKYYHCKVKLQDGHLRSGGESEAGRLSCRRAYQGLSCFIHNIALSEVETKLARDVECLERKRHQALAAKLFRGWREFREDMSRLEIECEAAIKAKRQERVWNLLSKRMEIEQQEFEERSWAIADRCSRSKLLSRNLSAWSCYRTTSEKLRVGYQSVRDRNVRTTKTTSFCRWMRVKKMKAKQRGYCELADQHRTQLVMRSVCFEWKILKQENRNKDVAKDKADVFREYKTSRRSLLSWRWLLEASKRKLVMQRQAAMHHYLRMLKGPLDRWGGGNEFSFLSVRKQKRRNLLFAANWHETKFRGKKQKFVSKLIEVLVYELSIAQYYREVLKRWRKERAFEGWIIFIGEEERRKTVKVRLPRCGSVAHTCEEELQVPGSDENIRDWEDRKDKAEERKDGSAETCDPWRCHSSGSAGLAGHTRPAGDEEASADKGKVPRHEQEDILVARCAVLLRGVEEGDEKDGGGGP